MNRDALLHRARLLAWFTIAYNLLEGAVSVAFGASDDSISLLGFGLDSFIEVGSALVVLWRLGSRVRERRAAQVIGILFLGLAASIIVTSILQLAAHRHPVTTVPGLVIALVSLAFMVFLWQAKLRVARGLDSPALRGDAACSLACIQLSAVLLAGSLLFLLVPSLWWVDAAAGMLLAALVAREGLGALRAASRKDFAGGCGCH